MTGVQTCALPIYRTLPPTINFEKPNPHINFEDSPFYVNHKLKKWISDKKLIIGVSSFGIGGTNAHVILEEPPRFENVSTVNETEKVFVLPVSAKSKTSLISRKKQLFEYLSVNKTATLSDISNTLWNGRNHMLYRGAIITDSSSNFNTDSIDYVEGKLVEDRKSVV